MRKGKMNRRFFLRQAPLWLAVAAGVAGSAALAQTPECDRYRAELASLGQGALQSPEAQRARGDLDRMRAYYQQIGCNRSNSNPFFSQQPPAECSGLAQRMRQMEANISQLQRQAAFQDGNEQRRQQLQAAISQYCRTATEAAPRQPNFFEQLFGGGGQSQQQQVRANEGPIVEDNPGRLGGSRVVCVRTCDGFFFPLPAGGREGAQEMCQALCPEAETQVFYMAPEGDIERGVSASGQPYTSLANASRYRRAVVPNCGCRKDGEKWVDALRRAEDLLDRGKSDIVVTAQKAEEMSRPKAEVAKKAPEPKGKKAGNAPVQQAVQGRQAPGQPEPEVEQPVDQSAVPTASKESAGIGPQNVGKDKTVGQREGQVVEMTGQDGKRQKVRVVAPNMFVSPQSSPTR
jgi:hypothetical protein